MSDLPSLAQRLNDVEINNNAPVSSQTFRRMGSDINFLLDYLNIDDGDLLAGPTSGLNVFSPPGSFSYSYTFTNADLNVPKTLFTFSGGGNRPLKFYRKSSNFESVPPNSPSDPTEPDWTKPIQALLEQLFTVGGPQLNGSPGQAGFIIKCNAVEMGRVVYSPPSGAKQYSREIGFAPAGTNTVTVTLTLPLINPVAVSFTSTSYLAL